MANTDTKRAEWQAEAQKKLNENFVSLFSKIITAQKRTFQLIMVIAVVQALLGMALISVWLVAFQRVQ